MKFISVYITLIVIVNIVFAMRSSLLFICLPLFLFLACSDQPANQPLEAVTEASLSMASQQYMQLHRAVPDGRFPRTFEGDSLVTNASWWWTSGFFPGSLWYLYEFTGDEELRQAAVERTWSVEQEKNNSNDHDIGFKIYCSFGNAYRITGDTAYARVMMTAAATLTERYDRDVEAIRSWGDKDDQQGPYQVIVDNMMNLELLFWATRFSGDSTYADIAINHADKTLKHHFRDDGSSYHVVDYDPQTGAVRGKRTAQGYADSSAWARGQAWGLYGYTVAYRETGYPRYLHQARSIADFLLNHPRLPGDKIPLWDYDAPQSAGDEPILRDASAGAIMASALFELSTLADVQEARRRYRSAAETMLRSLSQDPYRAGEDEAGHFLLMHSVGNKPGDSEVDVPLSYADYYYLEALMRYRELQSN